jgi:hypothetical protein
MVISRPPRMLYKGGMPHLRCLLLLPLGLALAGCGGAAPEAAAPVEAVAEPAFERGTVLGTRPLPATPPGEPRLRLVSQVVGAARGAGSPEANAVEVVVRLERGNRDVTLIQPAEPWLRAGQRVRLTPGPRPVLARDLSGA